MAILSRCLSLRRQWWMMRLQQRGKELSGIWLKKVVTINELMQPLTKRSPNLSMVVNGNESGYEDLTPVQVAPARIALNTGKHRWRGQHRDAQGVTDVAEVVEALVLRECRIDG